MTSNTARLKARVIEWALVILAVGVVLYLLAGRAKAEDMNITFGTSGYSVSGPHGTTIVAPLGSANPQIIQVPADKAPHFSKAHQDRWWIRCRPRIHMDDLGVQHFVYAKAGCEYGADRDADFEEDVEPGEDK